MNTNQSKEEAAKEYAEQKSKRRFLFTADKITKHATEDFVAGAEWQAQHSAPVLKWVSVKDKPLYINTPLGWECTEAGNHPFLAAVEVHDNKTGKDFWWIHHCVVEDGIGLCIVGDDDNEPAGWELQDIEFYIPIPQPPKRDKEAVPQSLQNHLGEIVGILKDVEQPTEDQPNYPVDYLRRAIGAGISVGYDKDFDIDKKGEAIDQILNHITLP